MTSNYSPMRLLRSLSSSAPRTRSVGHFAVSCSLLLLLLLLRVPSTESFSISWLFGDSGYRGLFYPKYIDTGDYYAPVAEGSSHYNDVLDDFRVYWNVPTFQCHKYGYNFTEVAEWGIQQNADDDFRGDKINLLYDPGLFPALMQGGGSERSDYVVRNGGVPHEGNLTKHLDIFSRDVVTKLVPDPKFSGLAVIDFEHWRPMFEENFGSLYAYQEYSMEIEKYNHPDWGKKDLRKEASRKFEKAATQFLKRTLHIAKSLRPYAYWGYYGYPFCFNYTPKNDQAKCSPNVIKNNEKSKWLFEESTAIYPSLYFKYENMNSEKRAKFMQGRMTEAGRVAKMSDSRKFIYPYTWLKYYDTKQFVEKDDLMNSFLIPKKNDASGVIIWGASNDVNSERKCKAMHNYLTGVLGPTLKSFYKNNRKVVRKRKAKIDSIFDYFI
ncbi:hyaluronidase-like isoform X2 [Sipha flava]|uniref:Hyaluronidase n=1 Tax=Sipha flava TaxID=143950 RepID=A0A8B8FPS9_9HEMI|nr:hyaluronidase-like isoform X2 [Sipha flava]